MPIKYDELMALKSLGQKYAYNDRDVMLYAYGIGMGADPMDEKELAFVNEAGFAQQPHLSTLLWGCAAVAVSAGLFLLFYILSDGAWIGFGDVRLGVVIGLLVATPALAAAVLFVASIVGILFALPSLVTKKRSLSSKIPFGPLLILALVIVKLFGQKMIDWYTVHLLFM